MRNPPRGVVRTACRPSADASIWPPAFRQGALKAFAKPRKMWRYLF
jgi:hypothetical protein